MTGMHVIQIVIFNGADTDGGAWPHSPFASTYEGPSWRATRQALGLSLTLDNIAEPRLPRSSYGLPLPRMFSERHNLMDRVIHREMN